MAIILVVDDDPTVRLIATELLSLDDHAVIQACDGDEAMKVIAVTPIDLVVLDMLMPNKDGLETIVDLRRLRPHVKILAISSGGRMGADHLLGTAMAFGADDTLVKPLRMETFGRSVARLLATTTVRSSPFAATA